MRGPTFYQLHLLTDKYAGEQATPVDEIAERVQTLGGVSVGDPQVWFLAEHLVETPLVTEK